MNKKKLGRKIQRDRFKIIEMYEDEMRILDIAKKYGVVETTMYRQLKKWGVSVVRKAYQGRNDKPMCLKRKKYSAGFLINRRENTISNDKHIKYIGKCERATYEQKLISNIINHPIIG